MSLQFHSTSSADSSCVRGFLQDCFQTPPDACFVDPRNIDWKYYREHPHWEGSRSFVFEDGGNIVAHACAWPFRLLTGEAALLGVHPIDWGASRRIPGAGALLLRQMRGLREISFCIGGSDDAQKVIAQTGYRPFQDCTIYARPLRPFRQFLTHQRRNWKLPARLARNLAWTARTRPHVPPEWSAERIEPAQLPSSVLPAPEPDLAVALRSSSLFEYLSNCPVSRYELFLVRQAGEPAGYFLLTFVPGVVRIADIWIAGGSQQAWTNAYGLAVRTAIDDGATAEITTFCTFDAPRQALSACGFRLLQTLPVMAFDPGKRLSTVNAVHLQMIDNDFSFLHDNRPNYET